MRFVGGVLGCAHLFQRKPTIKTSLKTLILDGGPFIGIFFYVRENITATLFGIPSN